MTAFGLLFLPLCLYVWRSRHAAARNWSWSALRLRRRRSRCDRWLWASCRHSCRQPCFINICPHDELCRACTIRLRSIVLTVMWPFMVVVAAPSPAPSSCRVFSRAKISSGHRSCRVCRPLHRWHRIPEIIRRTCICSSTPPLAGHGLHSISPRGFNSPRRLLDAYFVAACSCGFIALWQFSSNTLHVWYPTGFLPFQPWLVTALQPEPGFAHTPQRAILRAFVLWPAIYAAPSAAAAWVIFNGDKSLLPR